MDWGNTMREELNGIDYVFYIQKQNRHTNMIDLTTSDTVENAGESWAKLPMETL